MPYVKVGGLKELALRGKDAESIKVVVHPHHTSLGGGGIKKDKRRHNNNKFPKEERMTKGISTTTDFQTHHS